MSNEIIKIFDDREYPRMENGKIIAIPPDSIPDRPHRSQTWFNRDGTAKSSDEIEEGFSQHPHRNPVKPRIKRENDLETL